MALAEELAARTLALVDIPSVSGREERAAAYVAAAMPFDPLFAGDTCLFYLAPGRADRPLVVLAGHYDTVPSQENLPGRLDDGAVVGLGASDMKGGVAVMVELARWLEGERPELAVDVGFLFFGREELPAEESALPALFAARTPLGDAALVVMLEPTDNTIQAGCLGNLNASLLFEGESGHAARPWLADNAIDRAVEALLPIVRREPHDVVVEGLLFREVVSVTGIEGGIAGNVIPDRCIARLNYRYAPGRTPAEAEELLRALAGRVGTLLVEGNSPAAHVAAETPLVRRLREAGDFALEPKQAWTPVAEFAAHGLDAVNLGPGATRYAHRRDERVEVAELVRTYEALRRFVTA